MKNFVGLHGWASGGECTLPLSNRLPPKSTHHGCVILCWWVWDHLCSLALLCFWLPLRHMQWLSPTLPACSLPRRWVLVPSSLPQHSASRAQLTSRQPMGGRHAARQTARQDTPPQHVSLDTAKCNMASRCQPRQLTWSPLLCAAAPTDQTSFTSLSVSTISPHVSTLAHQHWLVSIQGWCSGKVQV